MLMEDIRELKPTIFGSFPQFFNKIYNSSLENIAKLGKKAQETFTKALKEIAENFKKTGKISQTLDDRFIFDKVKDVLGGKTRLLISGGAPLSQEVKDFLFVAFGCPILEAFGISETSGATSSTSRWETRAGVVGGPIAGIKMKLIDLPEYGYLTTDEPPRGEICVKGNSVFKGYFRNPDLTKSVLGDDGWLRLGDVGVLLPGGCLKLIDRVSSICKLQHGLYVAPQYLENIFGQC